MLRISVPYWHIDVDTAYRLNKSAPARHPDIHTSLDGERVLEHGCY
jgi:hypothetical protein